MKASDVMVSKVITVGPDMSVEQVAKILLKSRISAVPVVSARGELVGIVSEGDLMRRPESGTLPQRRSWWLDFTSRQTSALEYVKTHALKAADVMTRNVVSAAPETSLEEIAGLLENNRIKRVPIVQNGKIVGIVSRANLIQALAKLSKPRRAAAKASDSEIKKKVIARLSAERWCPAMLNVTVRDGAVELWGYVYSNEEKRAARIAVESTPGVTVIADNLMIPPATMGGI
jgi:CBS domain-containing protein